MLTALLDEERERTWFKSNKLVGYAKNLSVFKKPNMNIEILPMKGFKALN